MLSFPCYFRGLYARQACIAFSFTCSVFFCPEFVRQADAVITAVHAANQADAEAVRSIIREATAADPDVFAGAKEVTLVHQYDAVDAFIGTMEIRKR